ncbi:hypothetical protein TVAG_118450 [Trichomonas vaginalis G3]|uniref:Serine aminopeptidase S33 domain-containing protein n=1 Tax=Trichomonas vaginalis (strain ATCC PRA-98 / G3) TaxID=412133 RepID=A2EAU8_TRIV3|nr:phospholipase-related family [Trichomonas vaginalis G3]EAY10193.1 hypothetical protein TVAG_118450 [Trichomonas vaginalis G3]KAI5513618.1 phospholipase-related family [Trichomonas vaginalis G3]|eukprot:XP_001322416.1 hypothetical protein [Trichomonas vaginalis G3]
MDKINYSFCYDGDDFTVNVEKQTLSGCAWLPPDGNPQYIVVFIHDIGSFVTHNHDVFDVITANRGAVYACDHLGHGRSPGPRLGCKIQDIIKEIGAVIHFASTQHPNTLIYLYGQGAGALAIMKFVLDKPTNADSISGILLESPWLTPWSQNRIGLAKTCFYQLLDHISPYNILDTGFTRYSENTDPNYVEISEKCPLYLPYITPHLYLSAMKAITNVRNKIERLPSTIHIMMCIGQYDTVFDPLELKEIMSYMKSTLKNFEGKTYNCGHLITKENERSLFLDNAIDFFTVTKKKRYSGAN